jgi:pimeloyl-ACP methyl ester carboxylesterase/DNA-binding SARP family transcriptional activator
VRFTAALPRLTDSGGRREDDVPMNKLTLTLHLHGYPAARLDARVLPLKLKRGLALLAYLAVEARPVGRDTLAALLWPDAAGNGVGRGRLRRLVHEVNALIGRAAIDGDTDTLRLAPGVASDLARTRAAIVAADLAVLAAPMAAELMAGFTLDGSDAFDDWLGARRREWREQVQRALERGAAQAVENADEADAATLESAAAALLRADPCSEWGHIARLHGCAAQGDGAALEAAYFEAAQRWRDELGVKPSARIEAAYAAGRAHLSRSVAALPEIDYAPTAHGDVAHACWGDRGPAIVLMWGLMTNLEVGLDEPRVRALVERLTQRHRVVMIDRRGMGLSERVGVAADAASANEDVCAVLDHLGIERAWLFGSSVGGTMALDVALRRPGRVAGLLLYGTSASGRWTPETPWALHARSLEAWLERLADPAHYDEGLRRFAPSAADDPHVQAWYARLLRNAASKLGVRELLRAFHATDLRERLPRVRVPTLVLQRRDDRVVPLAAGEQLARGIPRAELETLDGEDHFLWHGDSGAVVRAVERFVARHEAAGARRLAA